jgi:DNA-binding NtrC family response regulator
MSKNARILIIDDDKDIRQILAIALEEEGYCVDTAGSGKEAVGRSYSNLYNVAIIDCRLPDIEGTKLLGKLKETKPKMGKIMLTGYPSMDNAIAALNEGADAFFLKPVDLELLIEKINDLVKGQEEIRALIEYGMKALEFVQGSNFKPIVTK